MPACTTSELRELVCMPTRRSDSSTTTSRPVCASARATARPTTPAPMTATSADSLMSPLAREPGGPGASCDDRAPAQHRLEQREIGLPDEPDRPRDGGIDRHARRNADD